MPRINNCEAGTYAARRQEFQCNGNLYGRWRDTPHGRVFVVYSYGEHWPLYVWEDTEGRWYGNMDKRSTTTSKHRGQARPRGVDIEWHDTDYMKALAKGGRVGLVKDVIARRVAA